MQFTEVEFQDKLPIDGYGAGFFRVGGKVYEGAVLLLPNSVAPWGGYEDASPLLALKVDVLFIGTGAETAHIPKHLREALEAAQIGVEPMASPAACRTYNVLLAEGRRVAVALLPV
ncbi:Mth938-like domain-containing protein [Profundibacter sp.]